MCFHCFRDIATSRCDMHNDLMKLPILLAVILFADVLFIGLAVTLAVAAAAVAFIRRRRPGHVNTTALAGHLALAAVSTKRMEAREPLAARALCTADLDAAPFAVDGQPRSSRLGLVPWNHIRNAHRCDAAPVDEVQLPFDMK